MPRSLADLMLYTIAIDTKGLKSGTKYDIDAAKKLFPLSHYSEEKFGSTMKSLGKELKTAKKDLDHLTLTQLIQ